MAELSDSVRELAPLVSGYSDQIEADRSLPAELDRELELAGCYRMAVPREFGGLDLPWRELIGVVEELARIDGSVGWTIGQVAQSQGILGCFPAATRAVVFGWGPDVRTAGAVAPKGKAARSGEAWRAGGRWPFVTGCRAARWLHLNCLVFEGRNLSLGAGGRPQTRMLLVSHQSIEILDTWHVLGLRGSGSHDVQIRGLIVPEGHTFTVDPTDPACRPAMRWIAAAGLIVAACAVGIGQGAVDELGAFVSAGRRQSFSATRMSASPSTQESLGEAWSLVRAARALLRAEAAAVDAAIATGRDDDIARAGLRAAIARMMALALQAVQLAYQTAGGAVVYDTMPLQRRLRDAQTAASHVVAARGHAIALGALLAGEELPPGTV